MQVGSSQQGLTELASGIDALYLSGRVSLGTELLHRLEVGRGQAETVGKALPFRFGQTDWELAPRSMGKYRFWLIHPRGMVGLTASSKLPAVSIQPRSEFLHGAGPQVAFEWFRDVIEDECGVVPFTVKRLDLHADWQGWVLEGDDRHRFVCQGMALDTHEDGNTFTGFEFGQRKSGTVCARIYDKTVESAKKGTAFWHDIWGSAFDPQLPVLRVEFELGRQGLREYGIDWPQDAIDAAGSLWMDLTTRWLSYRDPTQDHTKSRWSIAPEWEQVSRASLTQGAQGIERMYAGRRRGDLRKLAPGLMGYLAGFAALADAADWPEVVGPLGQFVRMYGASGGLHFRDRVAEKRQAYGLP